MRRPITAESDPLWRMRRALLASMIVVLAAVGLIVAMHHSNWNWALFIWGMAIGVVGLAIIAALVTLVAHREQQVPDQRIRLRRRLRIYTFCWITVGLISGSVSATFDRRWIDIAVSVYVLVTFGAGLVVFLRRRDSLTSPRSPS